MGIFIIYIGIIGPLFRFAYTNFQISLLIKIIKFNGIKNMARLIMFIIFHVNAITCQFFNLSNVYCIFIEKNHILIWKFSN
jgi:hypothetical protein